MPLNREDVTKIQNWWRSRGVDPRCPFCGGNTWSMSELVTPLVLERQTGGGVTARIERDINMLPMFLITCDACAYTAMFSAARVGLVSSSGS